MRAPPRLAVGLLVPLLAMGAACGSDSDDPDVDAGGSSTPTATSEAASPSPEATASSSAAAPDVMDEPTVEGLFATGSGERRMAVTCYGRGRPVVVYDAGSDDSGISDMVGSAALHDVAEETTTCSFDRLGRGRSDKPPNERRGLDDLVKEIHAALADAGLRQPFVLVGSSWGGFDIYEYAGVHPTEVAALLMLDVPKGQADIQGVPAWDENDERVDYAAAERQMALHRKQIPAIPVTVVTAKLGQSEDKSEQRVWLVGSSDPRQVMVDTGHDVIREDPDAVVAEVARLMRLAGG
jgi:hypothetical protein